VRIGALTANGDRTPGVTPECGSADS
jgi:hypothetical protein